MRGSEGERVRRRWEGVPGRCGDVDVADQRLVRPPEWVPARQIPPLPISDGGGIMRTRLELPT